MVLEGLGKSLNSALKRLFSASVIDEDLVKELVKDIQRALLVADVDVNLVMGITKRVEKQALDENLPRGVSRREHIVKVVWDTLAYFLGEKAVPLTINPGKPNLVMLVGIQGSGKTTTIGKLARYYQKRGIKTGVICADNFRPGAYSQLKQLAERSNIPFWGDENGKDAVKLAKKGFSEMKKRGIELILLDTSGRHREETSLIKEMKSISKAVKPQEIMLVIDGTLGQQAGSQAAAFKQATNIGSIVITKLDGSAKGGGALSAAAATQAPIKFIGTGEGMDSIEPFNPTKFAGRLLGMSDIKGLIEKVQEAQIEIDEDAAMRLMKGQFTLTDMMAQLKQLKKMGPIGKVMEMLGLQYKLPDDVAEIQEDNLNRFEVIMSSMTKEELDDPKLLKSSRLKRIAMGSGTDIRDVRDLLKQYNQMKKMMKTMGKQRRGRRGGGIPGLPGLDGMQ
ncbi:MAG: signal recognition particle receptor subunit alpha [Candidatus Thorarchaeota archaeon]|nr:MAG: signal recognition particle protein [Candidatus Thorarchaeota archaeon]